METHIAFKVTSGRSSNVKTAKSSMWGLLAVAPPCDKRAAKSSFYIFLKIVINRDTDKYLREFKIFLLFIIFTIKWHGSHPKY